MGVPTRIGKSLIVSLLTTSLLGQAVAAPATQIKPPAAPASAPSASDAPLEAGQRIQRFTLRELGAARPLEFRGTDHSIYLPLTVRLDEAIVSARLRMGYTFSPALLPELSQFKVMVNDEALGTVVVTKDNRGTPQKTDVSLDPRFFTEFSKLRLQFIGHYTYDCEFPFHTSLWANISNESVLELVTKPLALSNDLALLPAPFFDVRDSRRLVLPFVFSAKPELTTVRNAGVLASWFGALAAYRGAQFPVLTDTLPKQHAVVLATNDDRPASLKLPKVETPTILVMPHPADPAIKLLVVLGRDAAQLKTATDALVLGQAMLTGERVQVQSVKYPERRPAYDAPTMAKTGTVVKLGELVSSPDELQTRGVQLNPISVNLRLPADIFTWESKGMPIDMRYRYTPPRELGLGGLSVHINNQLVESMLLRPAGAAAHADKVAVPFLDNNTAVARQDVTVPAFHLGATNRLDFRFDIPPPEEGRCRTTWLSGSHAAVDPDSTIDLTKLEHYAALPNLAFYASSGFPFTKYADLAETAIVLPDTPQREEIEAALTSLGQMGSATGLAGTRLTVLPASRVREAADKDLLMIASGVTPPPLAAWNQTLPARLEQAQRSASVLNRVVNASIEWFTGAVERTLPRDGWATLQAQGPLGAMLGFESPLASGRSVVVINGTEASALPATVNALLDPSKAFHVHGDLTLVRGETVEAFRIGDVYHVGHLSWWRWLWFQLHNHPLLLALLGLLVGVIVALLLYGVLRSIAARRLAVRG